jgi:hypothetical protein
MRNFTIFGTGRAAALGFCFTLTMAGAAVADQVFNDDVIVIGSLCVGLDCANGESFGFDTIRLKENNTRIKFQDTSVGSFPTTDWQLTANESSSGGQSKFSIDQIDPSPRTPFTIESGAPTNSLYVDDAGRIGRKTNSGRGGTRTSAAASPRAAGSDSPGRHATAAVRAAPSSATWSARRCWRPVRRWLLTGWAIGRAAPCSCASAPRRSARPFCPPSVAARFSSASA